MENSNNCHEWDSSRQDLTHDDPSNIGRRRSVEHTSPSAGDECQGFGGFLPGGLLYHYFTQQETKRRNLHEHNLFSITGYHQTAGSPTLAYNNIQSRLGQQNVSSGAPCSSITGNSISGILLGHRFGNQQSEEAPPANTPFPALSRRLAEPQTAVCSSQDISATTDEIVGRKTMVQLLFGINEDKKSPTPEKDDSRSSNDLVAGPWSATSACLLRDMLVLDKEGNTRGSSLTKKNPKKIKKEEGRPKRPLSAYNLFFKAQRLNILYGEEGEDEGGDSSSKGKVGFEDLARIIGGRWRNISPEEAAHYKKLAKEELARYKKDMNEFITMRRTKLSQEDCTSKVDEKPPLNGLESSLFLPSTESTYSQQNDAQILLQQQQQQQQQEVQQNAMVIQQQHDYSTSSSFPFYAGPPSFKRTRLE